MPRPNEPNARSAWLGFGDAMNVVAELVAGTVVWGAVGWALDRWLDTGPALMLIGGLVGHATVVYMIMRRARLAMEEAVAQRKRPIRSAETANEGSRSAT